MNTYKLNQHWGDVEDHFHKVKTILWYNKGKNTKFRLIKMKLETLLKQRTAKKKTFWDMFSILFSQKDTQALSILETARLKAYTVILRLCTKY